MQNQQYNMDGLVQANAFLTSSNFSVMAQLAQLTAVMVTIQAHLKIFSPSAGTKTRQWYYCWS